MDIRHLSRGAMLSLAALSVLLLAAPYAKHAFSADASLTEAIDTHVEEQMDASRIPGVAVSIYRGGEVLHSRGYGHTSDNGRKVTPETPFIIGSTTKSITALAVMQLVERGDVELDSPVQTYIPWFTLADAEASSQITVRHLLTMTSGIPADAGGEAFQSTVSLSLEEAVQTLHTASMSHEPGSSWEYVNANYSILGLLIEMVSGQSYGAYLQENILEPLEMHSTYTDPAVAAQDGFADGYRYWFGRPVAWESTYLPQMVPAGYVISSAEDLSRYLSMYLSEGVYEGTRIISAEGIAELHRPTDFEVPLGEWAGDAKAYYAMGWLVGGPWGEQPTVFHTGGAPSFLATLHLKPDQDLSVVTLRNSASHLPFPGAQEELRSIPRGIMDLLVGDQPSSAVGINRFYLIFDAIVLIIVSLQVATLVRLVRRRFVGVANFQTRVSKWATTRKFIPLAWELGLGSIVLAAPALLFSWPFMWVWTPDLAAVVLVVGALWLVTGLVRAWTLFEAQYSGRARS